MRPFWVLFTVVGIAVAGALAFFATWPGFNLQHVTVSGNRKVTTSEILQAARISGNRSIWLENTGAIASRIGRIPYVASVSIHRLPPASLKIVVRERVPIAVLEVDDDTAVVDRSLRVLEEPAGTQPLSSVVAGEHALSGARRIRYVEGRAGAARRLRNLIGERHEGSGALARSLRRLGSAASRRRPLVAGRARKSGEEDRTRRRDPVSERPRATKDLGARPSGARIRR